MNPRKTDQSPCLGCSRTCNYTQCGDYYRWLNRCWNRYRRWPELLRKQPPQEKKNVWQYESPAILQAWLEQGPCRRCPYEKLCGDRESCNAYDAWAELRWERLRRKLQGNCGALVVPLRSP